MMISLANQILMLLWQLVHRPSKLKLFLTIVKIRFGNGPLKEITNRYLELGIPTWDILKNRVQWSDTNPGFIFDFLIHDQFNQQLQVDVYDKDADWDDHLGGFTIDIISGKNQSWGTVTVRPSWWE